MIIGEALIRIRAHEPAVLELIVDSPAIIRFRNLLVQGYDAAQPETVFGIAGKSLTDLKRTAEHLLSDG